MLPIQGGDCGVSTHFAEAFRGQSGDDTLDLVGLHEAVERRTRLGAAA